MQKTMLIVASTMVLGASQFAAAAPAANGIAMKAAIETAVPVENVGYHYRRHHHHYRHHHYRHHYRHY